MLRWRCDARVFRPLPIEIIARQKVAPAFEQEGERKDGRLELLSDDREGSRDWDPQIASAEFC